jgi:hypothetical protein
MNKARACMQSINQSTSAHLQHRLKLRLLSEKIYIIYERRVIQERTRLDLLERHLFRSILAEIHEAKNGLWRLESAPMKNALTNQAATGAEGP